MDQRLMIILSIVTVTNGYEILITQRDFDLFDEEMSRETIEGVDTPKWIKISGKTRGELQRPVHFKIRPDDIEGYSWSVAP